jgi:hypothetical protein
MHSQTTKDEQTKDDSSNEKQDAIERRRLQNRLSQRNHRQWNLCLVNPILLIHLLTSQ